MWFDQQRITRLIAEGRVSVALDKLDAVLEQTTNEEQWSHAAWVCRKRAQCLFMQGDIAPAILAAGTGLEHARQAQDEVEEAELESTLGILYSEKGDLPDSMRHFEQSYRLHQAQRSPRMATVLNNIGNTCLLMADAGRALRYFEEAQKQAEEGEGLEQVAATARANAGRALVDLGRYDKAIAALRDAVRRFEETQEETLRIHSIAKLAGALAAAGQTAEAEELYRDALASSEAASDRAWMEELYGNLAMLLVRQDRYRDAAPYLEQAIQNIKRLEGSTDLPHWLRHYGVYLEQSGDLEAALEHTRRAFDVLERVAERRTEQRLFQAMGRFELERIEQEKESYRARNEELEHHNAELSAMTLRDPLTGIFNRRWFASRLPTEIDRARRYGHDLAVAIIDLDYFKEINDAFGHPAGDRILAGFAEMIDQSTRVSDDVARYGGEEFAVVMPETGLEEARFVCEKLRQTLEKTNWSEVGVDRSVTLSAGVACLIPADAPGDLVDRADRFLYAAKQQGRNRTVSAE